MSKITVAHIITSLDMGGAERMLSNIAAGMDPDKFNNIVISLKGLGFWGKVLQEQGITVYALEMRPTITSLLKLWRLWRILRQHRPDYVQGWMYHANLVALFFGKLAGVKKIYWNIRCSTMDLQHYSLITRLIYKLGIWFSGLPHCIINNSQHSIEQHCDAGYRNSNWRYIPNGFDLEKFRPNPEIYKSFRVTHGLTPDSRIIGMFARFDWMKDHATFLRAAAMLAQSMPNVYFVMAGTNINLDNPKIKALIVEGALEQRVLLLGAISNVHAVLPAMDFVTQTSIFGEGFPNVLGEAMACGVPCVCTDIGDSLAVIGDLGHVIPTKNPAALAALWTTLLNSLAVSNTQQHMSAAVRTRIAEHYSLERVVEMYAKVYV